jgi:hypothetical protein
LGLSGIAVFGLMRWGASKLPPAQQAVLTNEVLVARGSLREPMPDIQADVEKKFQERLKQSKVTGLDQQLLRRQIEEQVKWYWQLVPPSNARRWTIDLGWRKNRSGINRSFCESNFTPGNQDADEPKLGDLPRFLGNRTARGARRWRKVMSLRRPPSMNLPLNRICSMTKAF